MSTYLATVRNPALVSRHDHLALVISVVVSSAVHALNEVLARGTLMGRIVANGLYRAYAEGVVATGGAFATGSPAFTIDVALSPIARHFRVGDVIESVGGVALGTILTYNPVTGAGTLAANSAANLAAGQRIRIALSVLKLSGLDGRLLTDEYISPGQNAAAPVFFEGFFVTSLTTVTAAAITAMGAVDLGSDEIRLK